jgi:hypothetical protein
MKKYIFTLIAILSIFSACKKDNDNNNNPGGTGEYQPLTTGSTWSYRNEATLQVGSPAQVDTTVNTMTATTKTFGSKTFHKLTSVTGAESEDSYIGFNNHIYTTRSTDDDGTIEFDYLDETKDAGYSVTTPIEVEDVEGRLKTTVAEKGISKVILGKTYHNVIHTTIETQVKAGANYNTIGAVNFYVAKGVGIIAILHIF